MEETLNKYFCNNIGKLIISYIKPQYKLKKYIKLEQIKIIYDGCFYKNYLYLFVKNLSGEHKVYKMSTKFSIIKDIDIDFVFDYDGADNFYKCGIAIIDDKIYILGIFEIIVVDMLRSDKSETII